jgi:hypothetical protein
MKAILVVIALLAVGTAFSQTEQESIVRNFVGELKGGKLASKELLQKYVQFTNAKLDDELLSAFNEIIKQLKERLNANCDNLSVIKHSDDPLIKSFNLVTGNAARTKGDSDWVDTNSIYYVSCDGKIIFPVLLKGNKILTFTAIVKSEAEDAPKYLMLY